MRNLASCRRAAYDTQPIMVERRPLVPQGAIAAVRSERMGGCRAPRRCMKCHLRSLDLRQSERAEIPAGKRGSGSPARGSGRRPSPTRPLRSPPPDCRRTIRRHNCRDPARHRAETPAKCIGISGSRQHTSQDSREGAGAPSDLYFSARYATPNGNRWKRPLPMTAKWAVRSGYRDHPRSSVISVTFRSRR